MRTAESQFVRVLSTGKENASFMAEGSRSTVGVLIVDDHAVICTALRMLIESHPNWVVVGEAGNGEEAKRIAAKEQPEVILLDLRLGDENGVDLIHELLAAASEARILLLTGSDEPDEFRRAVRLGAMGVVSKSARAETLVKAVDRTLAGELWLNRHMTADLVKEMRTARSASKAASGPDRHSMLTSREREIIDLLAEGLKNKQIANRLCISETTVRHHLTSILKKLELTDRLELLIYAYRNNLVTLQR